MSSWWPTRGSTDVPGPEHIRFVDPTRELDAARRRWEVRTAEWRAVALAQAIFGGRVGVRLEGGAVPLGPSGRGVRFRGLLHLDVPFQTLELHRWREEVFRSCAAQDAVLARVPLVYVFAPERAPAMGVDRS